ncbi:MAG: ABC transporter ATP-binding protein [Tannerella sp.]|jgi:ABC-type multidrug transport system ATPase subunit|nr:ABC transporter ATP-binding protein [Tannerella sp.]
MTTISVENIEKKYGNIHALENVSFQVNRGELFGLIGPDGAGKTSLFRILATLQLPDNGFARINGKDTVVDFEEIRKTIGYMPGRFSLYQDLTVQENLRFFADVFSTTIESNYAVIKDIYSQIEPFKTRRAGNLSGGMKQKLALCCALIHKPDVLILDEPTTGVDPVSRKEFWGILQELKRQGITIIVSTPYMDEASLCDRIALIQSGRILSIDTPEKIISNYPYKLYAVKSNDNYTLLENLRKQRNVHNCYIFGEYLHVVFNSESEINADILEKKEIKPTIEDCFMQLMEQSLNPVCDECN